MPSFPQPGTVTVCEINRELVTADHLSDDQARETYAKILGTVFSPIPFESDNLLGTVAEQEGGSQRKGSLGILSAATQALFSGSLKPLFQPADVKLLQDVDLHSVSWHQHKNILAFISGPHHVTICDYDDCDGKPPCVLSIESQKDVKILEWRPNGGKTLSVACNGGICIWAASSPGNVPSVRSGVTSNTLSRGSGARWTLVDFLQSFDSEQISALSWSPDGRYPKMIFRLGMNTMGATWDPDGRMILLSFSESSTLGSIHFASKPPSLDAHLIPVELPEIKSLTDSRVIEKIAWDASGERLAVSYRDGDELYKGLIAIFDVKRSPLISTSLIGFIRGPGDIPKPIAFSFHDKFKQGPLLSVLIPNGIYH
ncbi:Aladin [Sesamum angolense]|uniref:Aladin n=1 Tax=Sesamum angolense TaxID=2727404 RepID=A0AAE1WFY5_9LAMI|nr:Aladin [Sesamum angolense]